MNKISPLILLVLLAAVSCKKDTPCSDSSNPPDQHIKHFGFTLIDTFWDDPTDSLGTTNYAEEVAPFSNLADILVLDPSNDIVLRMDLMESLDMKSLLHLNDLFFEIVGADSPSGTEYALRSDFSSRWDLFATTNQLSSNQSKIGAFYIGEEPTWNGIPFEDLNAATAYVKSQFPEIPIMIIEAYPIVNELQIPMSVDWFGFDQYFVKNPAASEEYSENLNIIKSKQSSPDQKLVFIMDSHYISWAHGDFGNISLDEMKEVATNYYNLAKSESNTIAVLGYFWPSGFDTPESIGARGMPLPVKDEYVRIGKEITGK